jgi:hypothetical protein
MIFRRVLIFVALSTAALAQTAPWTSMLRGSWVQAGAPATGDIILAGKGVANEIVAADNENSAVHQAAEFLAGDIEKISGAKPPIVKTPTADRVSIRLVTLGNGQIPAEVNAAAMQGQWEAYRVATIGHTIWLVGSNPRGTAFAAYALSERLGIDPIYLWTGYVPEHHDPLVMKHASLAQNPPAFRYRGWFHDDEDLLPRPFDANGYPLQTGDVPLDWYKRFFETALRLRMNMVAPYTRVHRRYEVQKLASDWGLYYTSHHYDILLSNPFGLTTFNLAAERGVKPDWNWFTNKDGMLKFWRGGLEENKALDCIWPVGMRGTSDRPFTFPPNTTEDQRAATFREVINDQVKMAHEVVKDRTPLFHFTMYSEMLPAYQRNPAAFDLPEDVMIVWPDDNDGHMRGLPTSLGKWKHGVYYHLAYLGGQLSKQLTHTVTPATVASEFEKIVKSGATEYMLVNMSEVRDYVMGGRMIADITWDAKDIYAQPNAAARYNAWWSHEYFNPNAAAVEQAYNKYDAVLDVPNKLWVASDAIEQLLDRLYKKVAGEPFEPMNAEGMAAMRARTTQLDEALGATSRALNGLSMTEQRFLSIDIALGLETAHDQALAAVKLDEALRAPDAAQMWQSVRDARTALENLEVVLSRGEYPPFDRWYEESWIRSKFSQNNPHRPYIQLRAFIGSEGKGTPLKLRRP